MSALLHSVLDPVKTRDIYGFEVDAKHSPRYRAFFEKHVLHTQKQTSKVAAILEEDLLKGWECTYLRHLHHAHANHVHNSHPHPHFNKVSNLVKEGLPLKHRGEVWLRLTGVAAKVQQYEGVYASLLEPYERAEVHDISNSPSTIQIEKDVPRTFPGYIWTPKGREFQPSLRRLLRAYALRNPHLGYCQSMNFIAGGLLVFMEEEEAFWTLCFIVEEMLPDYFTRNIIGPQVDAQVFGELIAEQLPQLWEHFVDINLNIVLVCTQWFMCMYIRSVPFECTFRIWDAVFLHGPKVLFEVGLAILKLHQKELMTLTDTIDIVTFLSDTLSDSFDCGTFWDVSIKSLDNKKIATMREAQKEKVLRDIRLKKEFGDIVESLPSVKFSREELEEFYNQYVGLKPAIGTLEPGLPMAVFEQVISRIFPMWNAEEYFMERLFQIFDAGHDAHVDFKELICGLSVLCRGSIEDRLKMCFQLFDRNMDGFVDRDELRAMLTSMYALLCDPPEPPKPPVPAEPPKSPEPVVKSSSEMVKSLSALLGRASKPSTPASSRPGTPTPSRPSTPPEKTSSELGKSDRSLTESGRSLSESGKSSVLSESASVADLADSASETSECDTAESTDSAKTATGADEASKPAESGKTAAESGKPPANDFSSEVSFFVDMLFNMADTNRDDLLSFSEFKEAALLHPFILKTFNLHGTELPRQVRISIGRSGT